MLITNPRLPGNQSRTSSGYTQLLPTNQQQPPTSTEANHKGHQDCSVQARPRVAPELPNPPTPADGPNASSDSAIRRIAQTRKNIRGHPYMKRENRQIHHNSAAVP
ncbi:hypothetical protein Nepgr_033853 [Nepenthes gracilis]|uniref:Uncharacterized protein n=1 Tax=Nepenthes gracilis TaxID=150966 RepID=A0AAD3Y8Z4_NEPGR|nr:hypothetical protein Nepgr_033853 [Nepenthes gracilis]